MKHLNTSSAQEINFTRCGLVWLPLDVVVFEGLSCGDPLGLVETEEFPEQVDPLTGNYAHWGRVTQVSSSSQTFTDLGQVGGLAWLTERHFPLVP